NGTDRGNGENRAAHEVQLCGPGAIAVERGSDGAGRSKRRNGICNFWRGEAFAAGLPETVSVHRRPDHNTGKASERRGTESAAAGADSEEWGELSDPGRADERSGPADAAYSGGSVDCVSRGGAGG